MAILQYDEMFNSLLLAIKKKGGSASIAEMEEETAKILKLTKEEVEEIHRGNRTKFSYRLAWTRNYLKRYGVIEKSSRGIWKLTPKGEKTESLDKEEVNLFVKNLDSKRLSKINLEKIDINKFLEGIDLDNFEYRPHKSRNLGNTVLEIINNAEKRWVLPNFQRYYDWTKEDVRAFLESIFKDYFVGSLLLWDIEREPGIATFPITGMNKKMDKPSSIILDGQQRITSLYYAIKAPEVNEDSVKSYFYINFKNFFNENSSDIVIALNNKLSMEESASYLLFPFYKIEDYLDWFRKIEDEYEEKVEDKRKFKEVLRLMQDRVKHFLEGFQIPDINLPPTMKLHHVVDIFENINTKGKPLDAFDLLIAASSKHKIDLRALWDKTCEDYPNIQRYYQKTNKMRMYIMQAISLIYHPTNSCKRSDILEIYEQIYKEERGLTPESFKDHWNEMAKYVNEAISRIEDLKDGFGVIDENYLPFMPTIPILAALIKETKDRSNRHDCNNKIKQWYWSIVFNEAYSSSVDSQLTSDFRALKIWFINDNEIPKNVQEARIGIPTLDLDKVRVLSSSIYKGILSILALKGSRDLKTGEMVNSREDYNKDHIFPKSKATQFKAGGKIDSILNMAWLTKETNQIVKKAKNPRIYFSEFIKDLGGERDSYMNILNTHLIDKECLDKIMEDDFHKFIEARKGRILDEIKTMIGWSEKYNLEEEEESLDEILKNGESEKVEFKSTFKKNLETGKSDDNLKFSVLKTIAGFINSNGGKLIIGYNEKENRVLGLDEDYSISKWKDRDGIEKEIWDYLEANIPKEIIDECIKLKFFTIEDKEIILIEVKRSYDKPVYIEKNGKKNFYVRRKNKTDFIEDPEEADKYKKQHF